jgi:hypothetical protein
MAGKGFSILLALFSGSATRQCKNADFHFSLRRKREIKVKPTKIEENDKPRMWLNSFS